MEPTKPTTPDEAIKLSQQVMRKLLPLLLLFSSMLVAGAQPQPVTATIDAAKTGPPISKYLYGQLLEHRGNIINNGLWAEMLDDRKFYHPIVSQTAARSPGWGWGGRGPMRRWVPIGAPESVTMDTNQPFVGEHSPLVTINGTAPTGIRQGGLAVRKGMDYTGRVMLAGDPGVTVQVSLAWGTNADERQTATLGPLHQTYAKFPLRFTAETDSVTAQIQITGTGSGSFHIGTVSLMPADNLEGFRAEVIAALKQLHSTIYRFPGGNYASGYEWTDAIGDRDRRAPELDPAWNSEQPNDVGTDEFMALCRLLDAEPYITVNAGLGGDRTAADWVAYANSPATTPMGALRAANGHPTPYGVKFWGVGNEAWGIGWELGAIPLAQFEIKHNQFAKAMRAADPTIKLIASGAMPDAMTGSEQSLKLGTKLIPNWLGPADWTGGLFANCLDNMDLISQHFYSYNNQRFDLAKTNRVVTDPDEPLIDWMRRPANHIRSNVEAYQEYLNRIPALKARPVPICLDQWSYQGVPANSYKVVPAYAWTFHEMFRHSDLFQMANFTYATLLVSAGRNQAELNPAGLLFKLYRDHYGTIPVEITGNSPHPKPKYPPGGEEPIVNAGSDTFPLDVVAAWTPGHKSLTIAVINPTESEQSLNLAITGADLTRTGHEWRMAPSNLNANIVAGQNPGVQVEDIALYAIPMNPTFAPYSVNLYEFPAK